MIIALIALWLTRDMKKTKDDMSDKKADICECIESQAEELVLPEVPYSSSYCFGANIANDNTYWLTNYKRYYHIPNEVQLSFMNLL